MLVLEIPPLEIGLKDFMKAKRLKPSKDIVNVFEREGIMGFAYLDFDINLGPIVKYYYVTDDSSFVKKLLKNPSLVAEITIIGKHANEVVTENNERLLIKKIRNVDELGREVPNFIIIETKGRKKRLAKRLMENLSNLNGESSARRLNKIIKDSLLS